MTTWRFIFGSIFSKRLGKSLRVDNVPYKIRSVLIAVYIVN